MVTRRALLAAGAGALAAAGCGEGEDVEPPRADEAPGGDSSRADVALLNDALAIERRAGAEDHARTLEREIRRAEGEPNPLPLASRAGFGRDAIEAEKIAFYVDVLPKVNDPRLRRVLAGLLAAAATAWSEASGGAATEESFFAGGRIEGAAP